MNFNSPDYLVFLPVVFALHWALPHRFRWALLLGASWLFYFWWDLRTGFLLVGTTLLSWLCAGGIAYAKSVGTRRALLVLELVSCLGCLALFKYSGFFASLAGIELPWRIMLPVGISFYTFQTLSYVIDVYRGRAEAERHFGYYALFVAFFPQLVAGPIERPGHLLPQLKTERSFCGENIAAGGWLLLEGYFIADSLAPFVDQAYDIYFETPTDCVKEKIGFRTVEIKDDVLYFNGKKVKFKGVNHHDSSPTNGYTMTPDEIERDVKLCKEFNIDTIRTSHYPPDPLLLELADELGVYIVDENDLETHGTFAHQLPPTYNSISHDPKWQKHYLDRITRLYQRDKIHGNTAIFMWSLGNEAGGYHNTDAMYGYLKTHSGLPVHYESAIHCKREAYDVGSEMYPSVEMVHNVGEKRRKQKRLNDRPYFMCEYAHAMGVGPGNTEAYWQEIYQYDSLMGGCVWEMVDHAVLHKDGSYTYGGDHGEWEHDGNFCVDGLFYPDRTPSVGAKIMKFIYRPIRVRHLSGDQFEVFNTTAFSSGNRYRLDFQWNDGSSAAIQPDVEPLSKTEVRVELGKPVDGTQIVTIITTDTKTGKVVSEEQLILARDVQRAPALQAPPKGTGLKDGKLVCGYGGKTVLAGAEQGTLLYRAGTDNDTDPMFRRVMEPYQDQTEEVVSTERTATGYKVVTKVSNRKNKFTVTDTYDGVEGGILVTSVLHCVSGGGYVPRFGKSFRLDELFDTVRYVGRCGESYCDMKEQFPVKDVTCTVKDMTEPNIRPQESGNRSGRKLFQPFGEAIPENKKFLLTLAVKSDKVTLVPCVYRPDRRERQRLHIIGISDLWSSLRRRVLSASGACPAPTEPTGETREEDHRKCGAYFAGSDQIRDSHIYR